MPMTLTGEVTLNACGCTLKVSYTAKRRGRAALHDAQKRVKAMLKQADNYHVCARVSPENPNGDFRRLEPIVSGAPVEPPPEWAPLVCACCGATEDTVPKEWDAHPWGFDQAATGNPNVCPKCWDEAQAM